MDGDLARTVNHSEYAARRLLILGTAEQLVFTKGYEQMSIQDILDALGISKGAFYHYFASKPALLEAMIERGQEAVEAEFRAVVDDSQLHAIEKLQRFFAILDRSRLIHQAFIADLVRVWFTDDNAIVREKVDTMVVARRAPLLNAIVQQGIAEGVFMAQFPDQAGIVILAITRGLGNLLISQLLAAGEEDVDGVVATSAAMADAIERVLERVLHS